MGVSYEIVRKSHRVLTGLYEIQNLEAFLATVAADTKDQAPDEMSKRILHKWAMKSAEHFKMVEEVIGLLREEAKTVGDQCHYCIEDMTGWSLVCKYAKKYILAEDLYKVVKRNLELKEDLAERYSKLSQLVHNRKAKDILTRLSALEKDDHAEAQLLVDVLEKMYHPKLKQ